ncbi:unnamed protein product [Onchocerca flexuosa]|uniref:Uncharacterized protein n=1 Tax=Onchocerca flexuosa TaxID=387005 RepID=A0A183HT80_9BILA|nr:unnamed protein product [Onchocerca flexuosa]
MESAQHDGDASLLQINSTLGQDEDMEFRARSPQHVEMYTFRDAIDVNYQRMAVTGEELSGVCKDSNWLNVCILIEKNFKRMEKKI